MRSIVYSQPGDSSVLSLVDRDVPQPAAGEVRVRVVVSGVNPTDWKARAGGTYGDGLPFPEITPNQDGAGVVDAVGPGVDSVAVGDRVWLFMAAASRPTGTAQEYTVVPVSRVVPLPAETAFDIGASLGVPAMTAHRALTTHEEGPARLGPGALDGMTVLVAGGAGAVGHAAIQLARWAGATVIATISSDAKAALATAAGAHHTVNYRSDDAASQIRDIAPDGVDIVVEVSIPQNADLVAAVLANHGVVSIYADNGGDEASIPIRPNMSVNARYQFLLLYTIGDEALAAAAEDVTEALHDGVLPVGAEAGLPLTRFDLADTAAAHDAVEGDTVGKVLIDVTSA
ncbi:NADPH:quinone reductase [Curtobacterium sp. MCLR17_007]|uniref:NADPH:quinone reductase n=1 Tax=Curtobacterium sp. MCLR17_007 TaxID=2175648 RepID=UPI000DA989AE|nr:NADPH:quinone reductase [Curtobacterium sp. MCLR17_007]WIB61501.1 NADPH:quinone reductase [Curtobacterium sp. MCLR17_007]